MDSLIKIIKYLFKKKGIIDDAESIDSFFDNGYSFPKFIENLYHIEQIPGRKQKPHSQYFQKINNELALKFICEKDPYIKTLIPNCEGENRINLIRLILLRNYFTESASTILHQLNIILKTRSIQCQSIDDTMKPMILLTLLSILTDDAIKIDNETNNNNLNKIEKSFQKANVPLIINENSFDVQNQEIYLIQIQIIFDIFAEKIETINFPKNTDDTSEKDSSSEDDISNIVIIDDDDEIDEDGTKIYKPEDFNPEKNSHDFFITNPNFNTQDWYPNDVIEDEALLLTIGFLAEQMKIESKDKINSFKFTLYNNFIPLFVMRYLNIKKIDHLKNIKKKETDILTYQEIKNIKIVIDYLKKTEK